MVSAKHIGAGGTVPWQKADLACGRPGLIYSTSVVVTAATATTIIMVFLFSGLKIPFLGTYSTA